MGMVRSYIKNLIGTFFLIEPLEQLVRRRRRPGDQAKQALRHAHTIGPTPRATAQLYSDWRHSRPARPQPRENGRKRTVNHPKFCAMEQRVQRHGEVVRRQDYEAVAEPTPQQPAQRASAVIREHEVAFIKMMNICLLFVLLKKQAFGLERRRQAIHRLHPKLGCILFSRDQAIRPTLRQSEPCRRLRMPGGKNASAEQALESI